MSLFSSSSRRFVLTAVIALAFVGCSKVDNAPKAKSEPATQTQPVKDGRTALDKYIAAPDTNYTFSLVQSIPGKGYTTYVLDMTSQAWLTTKEVDRPLWKHWMVLVKPDAVATSKSLLLSPEAPMAGKRRNPPAKT